MSIMTIIGLAAIAAVLFALALVFRAFNRPKWEREITDRQQNRQGFFERWRANRPRIFGRRK